MNAKAYSEITNEKLREQMVEANKKMVGKFWWIYAAIVLTFFVCLVFQVAASAVAKWSALYIPSVAKLLQAPSAIGALPANYFGVLAILMPAFIFWLAWGEDARIRWRYGKLQSGRGPTEFLLFGYFLALPFGIFFLYMMYEAPIEMPAQPRLWGQHVLHLMLNTHIGLLMFGSIAAFGTALFATFVLFYFWLPISLINNLLFKGRN